MSDTENKGGIPFQLVDISTEQFASFPDDFSHEDKKLAIDFGTDFKIDAAQHIVGVFTKFKFLQNEKLILLLECACSFVLAEEYWNAQTESDKIVLPEDLLTHLLVLAVGTARGIIHAKKPKELAELLLPTLNITEVVQENISFSLENNSAEQS